MSHYVSVTGLDFTSERIAQLASVAGRAPDHEEDRDMVSNLPRQLEWDCIDVAEANMICANLTAFDATIRPLVENTDD